MGGITVNGTVEGSDGWLAPDAGCPEPVPDTVTVARGGCVVAWPPPVVGCEEDDPELLWLLPDPPLDEGVLPEPLLDDEDEPELALDADAPGRISAGMVNSHDFATCTGATRSSIVNTSGTYPRLPRHCAVALTSDSVGPLF